MNRVLIVDDDEAVRRMIRLNLEDDWQVLDTGEPENALSLALEYRPDAVLLDLRMPRYSGLELCQTLTSFSATQMIPVIVVSGEAGTRTKELCRELGAVAYFEKPVNFDALKSKLSSLLNARRKERRSEPRVKLRVPLRLSGKDQTNQPFLVLTTAENVGRTSFLASCAASLEEGRLIDVCLARAGSEHVGTAEVIRSEWNDSVYPRYGCIFTSAMQHWILN